jgi:hypothetical protein
MSKLMATKPGLTESKGSSVMFGNGKCLITTEAVGGC